MKININSINWFLFLGLPAIYSPNETQLLIDNGVIQLCRKKFSDVPDEAIDEQYEERLQEQIHVYQEVYQEKRIEDAMKIMDKILAGKRKKVAKSGGNPDEVTEEAILEDVRNRAIHDVTNVYIQVPTQEPFDVGAYSHANFFYSLFYSNISLLQ